MNKSDNPQTDDMKFNMYTEEGEILCEVVKASFCADIEVHRDQLIRELAELNSSLESEKITRNHVIQKGAKLERENAQLRELAKMVVLYASGEALPTTEEVLARALDLSA